MGHAANLLPGFPHPGQTASVANEDQARFWNEDGGPRWVAHEQWFDVMLEPYGDALEAAAGARPGEHALDVGCGFGTTTLALARAVGPEGRVLALDLSEVMIARVRARATDAGLTNVIGRVADAQTDALPARHFALAVSRFGVMFFDDPTAAFANSRTALEPGGRLAFICWQPVDANELGSLVVKSMEPVTGALAAEAAWRPGPYALGDETFVRTVLGAAGWSHVDVRAVNATQVMGGGEGLDAAVTHCTWMSEVKRALADLDDERRDEALGRLRQALASRLVDGRVVLAGAAWAVTARA
jgi:SAM-dependent methyltransferase